MSYTTPWLGPPPTLTRGFRWTPGRIEFDAVAGLHSPCSIPAAGPLHHSVYLHDSQAGHYVPPPGRERFRFNLWINGGGAPVNGQNAEVIVSDFRFSATPGVFPSGCRVNPSDSLTVLSGSPALGAAFVLGVQDPTATLPPGSLAILALIAFSDPAFPCGTIQPGLGMAGGAGELLIGLAPEPLLLFGAAAWTPGNPVVFPFQIPSLPALLGLAVHVQGLLYDPTPGSTALGLTDALEICIQP